MNLEELWQHLRQLYPRIRSEEVKLSKRELEGIVDFAYAVAQKTGYVEGYREGGDMAIGKIKQVFGKGEG